MALSMAAVSLPPPRPCSSLVILLYFCLTFLPNTYVKLLACYDRDTLLEIQDSTINRPIPDYIHIDPLVTLTEEYLHGRTKAEMQQMPEKRTQSRDTCET